MTRSISSFSVATTVGSDLSPDPSRDDDFVMLEQNHAIPFRTLNDQVSDEPNVEIHPLQPKNLDAKEELIVSVQTPQLPAKGLQRANCDIVLVIDVSGSMAAPAPLPDAQDGEDREAAGLSILDLTKHAARTILETLKDGDRLGIVTFSTDAKVAAFANVLIR
jgi:hypothetical protein